MTVNTGGKIRSFAPTLFLKLRMAYGIEESDVIRSLSPINNREQIFKSNQKSSQGLSSNDGGSSGSFFFFSDDARFIVKTITSQERQTFLAVIKNLVSNAVDNKFKNSCLALIIGMFEIELQGFSKVSVMVMRNGINQTNKANKIKMVFDLKGSRYRRQVFASNASKRTLKNADSVMKDVDLLNYKANYD